MPCATVRGNVTHTGTPAARSASTTSRRFSSMLAMTRSGARARMRAGSGSFSRPTFGLLRDLVARLAAEDRDPHDPLLQPQREEELRDARDQRHDARGARRQGDQRPARVPPRRGQTVLAIHPGLRPPEPARRRGHGSAPVLGREMTRRPMSSRTRMTTIATMIAIATPAATGSPPARSSSARVGELLPLGRGQALPELRRLRLRHAEDAELRADEAMLEESPGRSSRWLRRRERPSRAGGPAALRQSTETPARRRIATLHG